MLLGKKTLLAVAVMVAWVVVSFYYRIAAIDANTAQTAAQVAELERQINALDQRVTQVSDDLNQAALSMNEMRPQLEGNVAEVKTMLAETLPAMRADLNRLATPPPAAGRR